MDDPGGDRELGFNLTRLERYEGPVRIEIGNLPPASRFTVPSRSRPGKTRRGVAQINGREVVQDLGTLGDIQFADKPQITVEIAPGADPSVVRQGPGKPLEFTIRPGQTISAKVKVQRHGLTEFIEFGKEVAGRNMPHGAFIDNLGLNGLIIEEGKSEREFFITAAPKTAPGRRLFHLQARLDGGQESLPAVLNVLPR